MLGDDQPGRPTRVRRDVPPGDPAAVARLGARERPAVGLAARFGLAPWGPAWRQARRAIAGSEGTPATEWDLSSLRIFKPGISLPTWRGRVRADGRVPIYNFVNRSPAPKTAAYSVKVSFCRDVLGGRWTYDGHVGTDFAVPVGTPVATPAPGRVLRVANDLDHGGLKVCTDHGGGLFTTSSHLSSALVAEGEAVERGRVIGLSGASGIELVLFFPWVAPHLHLNVWLDGEPADPFAAQGETPLWRHGNAPRPFDPESDEPDADFEPSEWDPAGVAASIEACRDPEVRERTRSFASLERRAAEILFHRNLTPAAFESFPPLYRSAAPRRPVLDLPFRPADFHGIWSPGALPGA